MNGDAKISGKILWYVGWPIWVFVVFIVYFALQCTSTPATYKEAYDFLRDITLYLGD